MSRKSAKPKKQPEKPAAPPPWQTTENIASAVEFALQNATAAEIGAELDITPEQAAQLVEIGLEAKTQETLRQSTVLRLARLNLAVTGLMSAVARGESEAINQMMRLETEIARLKLLLVPDFKRIFHDRKLLSLAGIEQAETKTGRPAHEPNEYFCLIAHNAAIAGFQMKQAAALIGISDDTFAKYYRDIYETARPSVVIELVHGIREVADKKLRTNDTADARWLVERLGPVEFRPFQQSQRFSDEKLDPANSQRAVTVVVHGGLPFGSTAENPGGDAQAKLDAEAAGHSEIVNETIADTGDETI